MGQICNFWKITEMFSWLILITGSIYDQIKFNLTLPLSSLNFIHRGPSPLIIWPHPCHHYFTPRQKFSKYFTPTPIPTPWRKLLQHLWLFLCCFPKIENITFSLTRIFGLVPKSFVLTLKMQSVLVDDIIILYQSYQLSTNEFEWKIILYKF